jgi:hypothetical protein
VVVARIALSTHVSVVSYRLVLVSVVVKVSKHAPRIKAAGESVNARQRGVTIMWRVITEVQARLMAV